MSAWAPALEFLKNEHMKVLQYVKTKQGFAKAKTIAKRKSKSSSQLVAVLVELQLSKRATVTTCRKFNSYYKTGTEEICATCFVEKAVMSTV